MKTPEVVPSSTKIKRSRVANVDTDRLSRRADYLVTVELPAIARDGGTASRNDYANRAVELALVEDELDARGVDRTRRTMAKHLRGRYVGGVLVGPSPKHYSQAGQPV